MEPLLEKGPSDRKWNFWSKMNSPIENEPFYPKCIGLVWILVTPSTDLITFAVIFRCPEGCYYALYNFEPSYF